MLNRTGIDAKKSRQQGLKYWLSTLREQAIMTAIVE